MTHLVDEAQQDARAAIHAMQDAARHARAVHARAELLRHMRTTAQKPGADPARVAAEWMQAWGMQARGMEDWPAIAAEMRRFSAAFCAYAHTPDDAADAAVRDATAGLEAALQEMGTTLADEMAARSECRHGWWAMVQPAGPDLPFWTQGAPPHCGG